MVGTVEGGVGRRLVAEFPIVGLVVRHGLVDLIRRCRGRQIDDRGELLKVRVHGFRTVPGGLQGLADDHRVGFADVVDGLGGDGRMGRCHHVGTVLGLHHPAAGQIADLVRGEIGPGEHRHHAVRRGRSRGVDAVDPGAGVG